MLIGGTGDDELRGGSGNDLLFGDAGTDSAVYLGPFANYAITDVAGVLTIEDLVGTDGTDTVTDVERIEFSDGVLMSGAFLTFADAVVVLGVPPNSNAFLPGDTGGPAIGTTWDPRIDHTTFEPGATLDFMLISVGSDNLDIGFSGTLLCSLPLVDLIPMNFSPGTPFNFPIPDDDSLVGITFTAQGGSLFGGPTFRLTNALDVTMGLPFF